MKNVSTGTGLALLATAIIAYPIVNRISSVDQSAHASVPVAAIAAAVTAQANPEPTIVWYGVSGPAIYRAWSDGTVETRLAYWTWSEACATNNYFYNPLACPGYSGWQVVASASEGYAYRSDINSDQVVDGADLATMLADWGDAPRYDIPPSDCPLNLINP